MKGKRGARPMSSLKSKARNSRSTMTPDCLRSRRQVPSYMNQCKEELYEEILNLQREVALLRKENNSLKGQLKQAESEISSDERAIKNLIKKVKAKTGLEVWSTSEHLVLTLKRNNRILRKENKMISNELSQLKKNIKLTRENEFEVQMRIYLAECIRLRKLMNRLTKGKNSIKQFGNFNTFMGTMKSEDQKNNNDKLIENHEKEIQILKQQLNIFEKDLNVKVKKDDENSSEQYRTTRQ